MESLAKTLNAIKKVTIGDKTYDVSAATLNDFAAYEIYLKRQQVEALMALDIPKKELYSEIVKINRDNIDPDDLINGLQTMTGIRWLIWRCVSKHEKDVTMEYIADQMDVNKIGEAIEAMMDMGEPDEGEQSGKK
jgi:hypothetical protein